VSGTPAALQSSGILRPKPAAAGPFVAVASPVTSALRAADVVPEAAARTSASAADACVAFLATRAAASRWKASQATLSPPLTPGGPAVRVAASWGEPAAQADVRARASTRVRRDVMPPLLPCAPTSQHLVGNKRLRPGGLDLLPLIGHVVPERSYAPVRLAPHLRSARAFRRDDLLEWRCGGGVHGVAGVVRGFSDLHA
jgi:hypothetical protein